MCHTPLPGREATVTLGGRHVWIGSRPQSAYLVRKLRPKSAELCGVCCCRVEYRGLPKRGTKPGPEHRRKRTTMSDTKQAKDKGGKEIYPVLPLRDIVVFPYMIVPLFVGREKSINALEEVMRADKQILLAAQKNAGDDDPAPDAIYQMGTLASVLQLLKLPDGTVKVLVEGTARAKVVRYTDNPELLRGRGGAGSPRRWAPRTRSRRWRARPSPSSRATSSSTRRSRPRCSAPSARSRTTPSSPTRSPRIWPSRSRTSRRSSRSSRSRAGWSASTR